MRPERCTYTRCQYVCGGYAGLHRSGKWSTWSPACFPIPNEDADFLNLLIASSVPYIAKDPKGQAVDIIRRRILNYIPPAGTARLSVFRIKRNERDVTNC